MPTVKRPTFGKDQHGQTLYWPDKSALCVKVPVPLEQMLEHIAERSPFIGQSAEEVAVYLIRDGIIQRLKDSDFVPDPTRYVKKGKKK